MAGSKGIRAGRAFVELFADNTRLMRGLRAAQARLQAFAASARAIGTRLFAAGAVIAAPLIAAVKHFASAGDQLDKMAARTGISTNALSELGFAAEQSGTNLESIEKAVRRMQVSVYDLAHGSSTAVDAFDALGISLDQLEGKSPDEQFSMIADALGGVEDASLKAALAQKIFGRAGTALIPMLGNVQALRQEAKDLGLSVDPEEAKSAADLTDAMNRVKRAFGAAAFQIGSALAPAMTAFAENVKLVVVAVGKWIKQNKQVVVLIAKVAGGLLAAGSAFLVLGAIASGAAAALGMVMSVIGAIGTVLGLILSPMGLIALAITGGIAAWLRWTDSGQRAANFMRGVFGQIAQIARDTFGGIWDAIAGGDLGLAGQIAMAGLKAALLTAMAEISAALGGQWGDTIGMLTSQILSGDLTGAWNTVVSQLSAVWARFVEGIVAVFTTAARALTDLWQKTTTAISDAILKSASEGGWGQLFLVGTGVNLEEEAAKSKEMDRQSAELARRNIARMQEDLAKAKEAGGSFIDEDGVTRSVDVIERQLADLQQQLARATGENTLLADTQQDAADMLAQQADSVRDALTDLDQQFQQASQEATQRAKESVADGATVAQDAAAEARAELERLRQQAAGLRGEAQRDAQAAADAMGFDMEDVKQTTGVAGTFSAVAASRGLGAGDAADRTADAVEAIDRRMAQLVREAQHGGIQFA